MPPLGPSAEGALGCSKRWAGCLLSSWLRPVSPHLAYSARQSSAGSQNIGCSAPLGRFSHSPAERALLSHNTCPPPDMPGSDPDMSKRDVSRRNRGAARRAARMSSSWRPPTVLLVQLRVRGDHPRAPHAAEHADPFRCRGRCPHHGADRRRLERSSSIALLISITFVLIAEMINTAIEGSDRRRSQPRSTRSRSSRRTSPPAPS